MSNINILIFPCGSEVALEIHRSLKYSRNINLFGANSVPDHGQFVFDEYYGDLPFSTAPNFIEELALLVKKLQIDVIYPAMDSVITILKENENLLGCKVIGSPLLTTQTCLSKALTYDKLKDVVDTPKVYRQTVDVEKFPAFMKPIVGYGSRGALKVHSIPEIECQLKKYPESIITEYLSGEEYTIDCFSNKEGKLLYAGARKRQRITNGISVNTIPVEDIRFEKIAEKINNVLDFRGAWFFQVKENDEKKLILMEIAARMGGSSALYRNKGVNFALLSVFDYLGFDVDVIDNKYHIVLDRALDNKYKLDLTFENIYVDFDDCLVIKEKVNDTLVQFLYQSLNEKKKLFLITKHSKDIHTSLKQYRLNNLFDEVIHIEQSDSKYKYINRDSSIFIDDSHAERKAVATKLGIPVFSPDMIESLLK